MTTMNTLENQDKMGIEKGNNTLPTEVIRLNCHERIQHLLIFVTFIILVLTGYMTVVAAPMALSNVLNHSIVGQIMSA